jgi:opacity protein-like surface antigen
MRLVALCLAVTTGAFAQSVSFGVRGGLPFTNFFSAVSNPGETFESTSTQFILGPTVELHLPLGFGVEADALYRHFHYTASVTLVDVLTAASASDAWEFPLLLKYRLPGAFVRPYLDAGVAFDHWSGTKQFSPLLNPNPTNSGTSGANSGFVAGAGIELHLPFVRLSPEIRYTRWGTANISDLSNTSVLRSNPNQAEFLVGLTF